MVKGVTHVNTKFVWDKTDTEDISDTISDFSVEIYGTKENLCTECELVLYYLIWLYSISELKANKDKVLKIMNPPIWPTKHSLYSCTSWKLNYSELQPSWVYLKAH